MWFVVERYTLLLPFDKLRLESRFSYKYIHIYLLFKCRMGHIKFCINNNNKKWHANERDKTIDINKGCCAYAIASVKSS